MRLLATIVSGLVMGSGLALAGMVSPKKIQDFLDVVAVPTGGWDPSLILVMTAGVSVFAIIYWGSKGWSKPMLAEAFAVPTRRDLDARLIGGAALFGVGWGLSGLCPGPAFIGLSTGALNTIVFVAMMVAGSAFIGIGGDRLFRRRRSVAIA